MDLINVVEPRGYFDRANRFVPKPYYSLNEHKWQEKLDAFIDYQKENPDVPLPAREKYHGLNLGKWVSTQRTAYKQDTLSADRIERLEEAGFVWDAIEQQWQAGYQAFIAYQKENPDVLIPQRAQYHDYNLGVWVSNQRTDYNTGTLSAERIERLEDAGIVWDQLEEQWQAGYATLIAYKEEHGDVLVSRRAKYRDLNLGNWVDRQRTAKTRGALSTERIERLEEAGFVWDSNKEAWQAGYRTFVAYKEENPDVPIPFNAKYHGINLGRWASKQRWTKNKGTLSAEKVELLEEAGIIWGKRGRKNNDY